MAERSKSVDRFLEPQKSGYPTALAEIRNGRKSSHWMWYIFPQLRGLGRSHMARYYGIEDLAEARVYLNHPVLGQRLREITRVLLELPESDPGKIFGWPDDLKLCSCMTLFAQVSEDDLFEQVLWKYFDGRADTVTIHLLRKTRRKNDD
ncbi:MAG: DUF1810 domain-containing protein [Oscillospiraceae bacterium]|nr:DUF1810 domain-containing protein [Oscillospiraceae bacterium]